MGTGTDTGVRYGRTGDAVNKGAFVEFEGYYASLEPSATDPGTILVKPDVMNPTRFYVNSLAVKIVHQSKYRDFVVISFDIAVNTNNGERPNFIFVEDTVESVLNKLNYAVSEAP